MTNTSCMRGGGQESMRLHPVAQNGMRRKVTRDCRLSNGMLIPRGTITTGSILASHTDPRYWGPNALEYVPVRFPNQVFISFSSKTTHSSSE